MRDKLTDPSMYHSTKRPSDMDIKTSRKRRFLRKNSENLLGDFMPNTTLIYAVFLFLCLLYAEIEVFMS